MTHDDKKSAKPSLQTAAPMHEASPMKYSQPSEAQRIRDLLLRANLSQRAGARELVEWMRAQCVTGVQEQPRRREWHFLRASVWSISIGKAAKKGRHQFY
jgi:hypothetical protein